MLGTNHGSTQGLLSTVLILSRGQGTNSQTHRTFGSGGPAVYSYVGPSPLQWCIPVLPTVPTSWCPEPCDRGAKPRVGGHGERMGCVSRRKIRVGECHLPPGQKSKWKCNWAGSLKRPQGKALLSLQCLGH